MQSAPHLESGLTRSFAQPPLRGGLQPVHGPVAGAQFSVVLRVQAPEPLVMPA